MVSMLELPLSRVIDRCAEESGRFSRGQAHDDAFCFELFRRAIVRRVAEAWEAIIAQYRGLVRDWIWQHSLASSIEDHDDLTTRAFERFWQAIRPERFGSFPHLASLLRYLKLCVFAALVDEVRGQRSWQEHRAASELADEVEGARVDETVLDELGRANLWQTIERALPDSAERLVIYLSCVIGLKPREIARRHREVYPSVEEVYRRKRLALERLRRDPTVRGFLGAD
jgi:RNA polymerase sigma factor (sigma-70 family)